MVPDRLRHPGSFCTTEGGNRQHGRSRKQEAGNGEGSRLSLTCPESTWPMRSGGRSKSSRMDPSPGQEGKDSVRTGGTDTETPGGRLTHLLPAQGPRLLLVTWNRRDSSGRRSCKILPNVSKAANTHFLTSPFLRTSGFLAAPDLLAGFLGGTQAPGSPWTHLPGLSDSSPPQILTWQRLWVF